MLDHPDVLPALTATAAVPTVDDLMTWYERQTDTLILRPLLPLEEMTEYAVVLTDRLHGPDGQPVRSPFASVYHPQQVEGMTRLQKALSDPTRASYYGDLAGTGLGHVAFAWTFTTQPVASDMRALRDGLYGQGPFARIATQFPPKLELFPTAGLTLTPDLESPGWQSKSLCPETTKTPFIVRWSDVAPAITALIPQLFALSPTQQQGLLDSLDNVDYFVVGTYQTPYFIGDPKSTVPYDHFDANFMTGQATIHADTGHFWISVPKVGRGGAKPPFPVAFWHHGTTLFDTEMFIHAGRYAKNGLALASIDAPGHGLVLTQGQAVLFQALLAGQCLAPFTTAVNSGRAIDLNGDGVPDSGGLIWSAHLLRTRDNVRQGVLDAMQMTRILASFDGKTLSDQDYDNDGKANDLAGDFNGDGVVDVGGPNAPFYASGGSLGGIMSMIQGALDPHVVAAAPVSGTAGFMDTAMRGNVTPTPVLEQVMGPLIVGVPASARSDSVCSSTQRSVRWVVNDLFNSVEIEIACLDPSELDKGMTVLVTNYSNLQVRCGRTDTGGTFRVPVPVSIGDRIDIQVLGAADAVDSYATCNAVASAPVGRRIDTWEQAAKVYNPVADPTITCPTQGESQNGCQQFRETFFPVGFDARRAPGRPGHRAPDARVPAPGHALGGCDRRGRPVQLRALLHDAVRAAGRRFPAATPAHPGRDDGGRRRGEHGLGTGVRARGGGPALSAAGRRDADARVRRLGHARLAVPGLGRQHARSGPGLERRDGGCLAPGQDAGHELRQQLRAVDDLQRAARDWRDAVPGHALRRRLAG